MEKLTKAIERFLSVDYDYSYGEGCEGHSIDQEYEGFDYNKTYGSGEGGGSGYGYDAGTGFGCTGFGSLEECYGLKSFNGQTVHYINGIATVIEKIHFNLAKGYIIHSDLTTSLCYIGKVGDRFAHGDTVAKLVKTLWGNLSEDNDSEERREYEEYDILAEA